MKAVIRLIVIAIVVVLIGWVLTTVVKIPGNIKSLNAMLERNSVVTEQNKDYINTISQSIYSTQNFSKESQAYLAIIESLKSELKDIVIKGGFEWKDEKQLKKELKGVIRAEKQLKDYLSSIIIYINSADVHGETCKNMIENSANKMIGVTEKYSQLKNNILVFTEIEE